MTRPEDPAGPGLEHQVTVTNSEAVAIAASGGTASVTIYGAPPPIDRDAQMRDDVAFALSRLESRNVLKAHIDNELWRYVFESLRNLRDVLADTSGKLRTRGPHDVSATLQFMVRAISAYLEEHDASYVRYMSSHGGWESGWAHVEREWITAMRGRPAEDLLALREAIDKAVANLNEYAEDGREIEWGEPWAGEYWASWARGRDG